MMRIRIRAFMNRLLPALFYLLVFCAATCRAEIIYFPHIASGGLWETEIALINLSEDDNLTGTLTACDASGSTVSENVLNLEPLERRQMSVGEEFANASEISYMKFESTSGSAAGYLKFYTEGRYRVAVPAVSEVSSDDIYISHIASDALWWTGLSLVNTTDSDKVLSLEFSNGIVREIELGPGAHDAFTIKSLFDDTARPEIASAVIRNGDGVIGLELFGNTEASEAKYLSGILLKHETSQQLCFSHVASDDRWWTGIVVCNPSDQVCQLEILPYRADGTPLASQSVTLEAHEKYVGTAKALALPQEAAWLQVTASLPVTGFELFGTTDQNLLAGYTGVNISSASGGFAKLETEGWTGIAFVNPEEDPADIVLSACDDTGSLVAEKAMSLAPHEKAVGMAEALFDEDIAGATYIRYTSDRQVVGFQLNGGPDGFLLDGLPASLLAPRTTETPCEYQVSSENAVFTASGGQGVMHISTSDICIWEADSDADWIILTSAVSGTGDGTVSFEVAANPGSTMRKAGISVAGRSISVTQSGAPLNPGDDPPVNVADSALAAAIRAAINKPDGDIFASDVTGLTHLEVEDEKVSDLDGIQYCSGLISLNLGINTISDLTPLAGLSQLQELDIRWNKVADLAPLSGLSELERLVLDGNPLGSLSPLAGLERLTHLSLNWTEIGNLNGLSGLDQLSSFEAMVNTVSDLTPLTAFAGLTELDLSWNDIRDISGLGGLRGLTRLVLKGNDIEDISALTGLNQLDYLDLSFNKIIHITPLISNTGIGTGDEVILTVNPLDETACGTDVPGLESRGVTVSSSCTK